MLRIDDIRLLPSEDETVLAERAAEKLRLPVSALESLRVVRRSVDARKGVFLVYSVHVKVRSEEKVLKKCRDKHVSKAIKQSYAPQLPPYTGAHRPVVVGAGPAGLFCALLLARAGAKPILLERGAPVEQRKEDVEFFWRTGLLSPASNVQFGEGGAGTFSDGKLNTGTHDPRNRWILEQLVQHGAPPDILIDAKPHVGTDKLFFVLQSIRAELLSLGCDIRYGQRLSDLRIENGRVTGVHTISCSDGFIETDAVVLALGHSARDTFEMLQRRGVPMEQKPFAVGVRIEHRQADIDMAQYKQYAGHPALPPTSYKLSCHTGAGRGVFSFCVCPGGQVVAAASEQGRLVTNGMSEYARDRENINGGFLVGVNPGDFESEDPLAGVAFQRKLEEAAYRTGGGNFTAPAQRVEDFLLHRPSTGPGKVLPSYRPGVRWTDLHDCLPAFLTDALEEALPILGQRIAGYDDGDAVLTAVESRSSSPVRIIRNSETLQSPIAGLYPCGEGAGYAGGIMSAAADGIRCAEKLLKSSDETSFFGGSMPMTGTLGIKADFLTSKHKQEIERIAAHNDLKIHYFTDEADMDAVIGQCEILYGYIPPEKLHQAESLRWLACASSGVEQYLAEFLYATPGVILTNSAGAYGITISEHILMTALMLLRRMPEYSAVTAAHQWENLGRIRSIYGSVITVIGTGDIGTAFAQRAKAMGAAHIRGVHRTNRLLPRCFDESYAVEDLDFALAGSDIVVLCVPGTKETENLITRERLGLLKKTSILINVGRGSVLDQDALMDALNGGKIAGAALDVTTPEPLPADHPLWHTKNLLITPHVSGNMTLEITCDLDVNMFCDNLTRYCRKQPMKHVVERSVGY